MSGPHEPPPADGADPADAGRPPDLPEDPRSPEDEGPTEAEARARLERYRTSIERLTGDELRGVIAADSAAGSELLGASPSTSPEAPPLAERLAALAHAIRHWMRDADRNARAVAAPGAPVAPHYARRRGRADALAALALTVRALADRAARAAADGAPWMHLPLDAYLSVVRRATASAAAEERAGAGPRAAGWQDAVESVAAELRPLLAPLDLLAVAIVRSEGWSGRPLPEGAPPPRDWPVWAHRRLDAPLVVADPARRGRPTFLDPRSEPLSAEARDNLPPARRWDASAGVWQGATPAAAPHVRRGRSSDAVERDPAENAVGDPEAPARARALLVRQRLRLSHRMVTADEAAALLGCTVDEVRRRAAVHELLALPDERGELLVPLVQLTGAAALPGLADVLRAAADVPMGSTWVVLVLLTAPVEDYGGRNVLALLRDGDIAGAVEVVRRYGEAGT